ncbi:MAG: peptidase M64 [Bacteroidia bacterium]|nr:MAG: peptidase M64 [Bacteroidia bacterium]PIE86458.1 MAG: peptidase M64 [Bacteroidia bacterium]
MKKLFLIILYIAAFASKIDAQVDFQHFFENKTMRLDFTQSGDASKAFFSLEQIKEEPFWGGSHKNLIDKFMYGDYMFYVYDSLSSKLIYSRGFSTIFREWQDTDEAKRIKRSFYNSIVFPYPKNPIKLVIQSCNKSNMYSTEFEMYINPKDYNIIKDCSYDFPTEKILDSGNPAEKLDIVILPEGYTQKEMKKFQKDAQRYLKYFFEVEPFKSNKDKVNFWIVKAISKESGTDIPGKNIWKNTILNSHFYTFYTERYLTTQDIRTVRDIASLVPYDQIYILVNTEKYGGGGVYNYYNLCASDNAYSPQVFTHEFGHAFAALGDEYAYSEDDAEKFYDLGVEPNAPNLTTLANFEKKWKDLVDKDTPIPTPEDKRYKDKVGAFEGGGYVKKGIYRPVMDCKMRSNKTDEFCPVCRRVLLEMLLFYSE